MRYNIFSWNVNGIRAILRKGELQELIESYHPDIICLQETKAKQGQAEIDFPGYTEYWNSATRSGYSGTAIFSTPSTLSRLDGYTEGSNQIFRHKITQLRSSFDHSQSAINPTKKDNGTQDLGTSDTYGDLLGEGRVLTVEYPEFYLVTVYTPNSKPDLSRLIIREKVWDPTFLHFLVELEKKKPVVVCGDFNAAHTEIDLARPKENEHNAGYTPEERQGIDHIIESGFVDTYRKLHPTERKYSWWSYRSFARENGIGWRIDYFFISRSLLPFLETAEIHDGIVGSDHCPISITLDFSRNKP